MPNIFNYQDYRQFLGDFYEEKKSQSTSFSYQNFSQKAGFSSKSFMFNVIKGKKDLSRTSVVKLSIAMNFSKTESAYFENLVYFNQATNFTERNFYLEKLNAIHPVTTEASVARNLRMDQYEFYSQWYHVVVRSLIDLYPTITDPQTIAKMITPPVNAKQVQKSIELLLRLGLVQMKENGTYTISSKTLSTGKDIHSQAVQQFHLTSMELASKALQELPSNKRNFSGMTLGISQDAYEQICLEIGAFKNKILTIAENDKKSDSVYQLNFQMYPLSLAAKVKSVTPGIENMLETVVK
jgi:uncharacterized protein (TIGR02147 family)